MDWVQPIVTSWLATIKKANDVKRRDFTRDAEEALRFFDGPHDFMYEARYIGASEGCPSPFFKMTYNKIAEGVQLFGPFLYHRNPHRQVNESSLPEIPQEVFGNPEDPRAAMIAAQFQQSTQAKKTHTSIVKSLLEFYLNYTPNELDLRGHGRHAIDEAIIKGMGVLWCLSGGTEVYAKIGERHTKIRLKDLHRVDRQVSLWDGQRWNRLVAMQRKPRQGNELQFTLQSGEVVNCTPEHRWPTQRGVLRADHMEVGDIIQSTRLPGSPSTEPAYLPDEIGWLVGLYLADGNIFKGKRNVGFQIAGHIDHDHIHDPLERLVADYHGKVSFRTCDGTKKKDAVIYSRVLVAVLREYIAGDGSYKKHLKSSCWERSDVFLHAILEGYLEGDGCRIEAEGEGIWQLKFCDNKQLASDIRTLCARLGVCLSLRRRRQGDGYVWRGRIRMRPAKESFIAKMDSPGAVTDISPADWRCDYYYDVAVESEPHLFALASGILSHNCEVYTPPGGKTRMIGSFYDTVDNLVIDPDMEHRLYAKWIARRRVLPKWEVEERFGLKPGTLRGNLESANRQAQIEADDSYSYYHARGDTNDLYTYWELYSRMGFGHHLRNYSDQRVKQIVDSKLEKFGKYVFLAVSEDYAWPLNIPQKVCEGGSQREIFLRSQWPTPFWADPTNPWPFVDIAFHNRPRKVWPMSHFKPALGEIRFLNWCFSFLADKIKNTSRDFIATLAEADEEIRTAILSGKDLTLLNFKGSNHKSIQEIIQFLQHPEVNKDLWTMMEAVMGVLERRIGLNELMYGETSRQLRSATEAQVKGDQLRIRPDDMAECVETAMTLLARKEAIAAYWHLTKEDLAPVLGADRAMLWEQTVQALPLEQVVLEFDYRIEAGSIRKPNRNRNEDNANAAVQMWGPVVQQYMQMTGDMGPVNDLALLWKKANDVDETKFIFQPPPPAPNPDEQKMQLEMQKMQAEMEMKQAELQLKLIESQSEQQLEVEKQSVELALDQAEHEQEMEQDRERHLLDMLMARQEGALKLQLAEKQGEANIELKKKQAAAAAKAKPKPSSNGSKR